MKLEKKIKRKVSKSIKEAVGLKKKPVDRNNFSAKTISEIRKFQHNRCAYPGCGFKGYRLQRDHIRGRDDNTFENCQLLCPTHHDLKSRIDKKKSIIGKRLRKQEGVK